MCALRGAFCRNWRSSEKFSKGVAPMRVMRLTRANPKGT